MADNGSLNEEHLAQADRHIAEAKAHIARQEALIQRLRQDGHETDLAEALLDILEGTLAAFKHHRDHSEAARYAAVSARTVRVSLIIGTRWKASAECAVCPPDTRAFKCPRFASPGRRGRHGKVRRGCPKSEGSIATGAIR